MNENESELKISPVPDKVKKPWVIYFIALWSFFGVSSYLNIIIRVLFRDNQTLLQYGSVGVLIFAITIIVFILKMNRIAIVSFGVLCIAIAIWQTINIVNILTSQGTGNSIVFLSLYYTIPSVILAVIALRPSFLKVATAYRP